ncbi:MAG: hypothetical protein ABI868_22050 [Acidobacteriota bacterium]
MCKTTTATQTAPKAGLTDVKPNRLPVVPGTGLQPYLDKYYAQALAAHALGTQPANDATASLHVPISLFAHVLSGSGHFYAGIHDDEMHFSASLMKVAAMFAADALRAEARALAAGGGFANETAFFTALGTQFNPADAVPAIQNAGVGLKPRYKDVLKVTGFGGGPLQVEFAPDFSVPLDVDRPLYQHYQTVHAHEVSLNHIEDDEENPVTMAELNKVSHFYKMIVPSNNTSAGECIRRVGYAYINVKLMTAGLYEPLPTPKGIWLAADFAGAPRVEIDSVNDGKSGQATTSRQMARFFSLIDLGLLVDPAHSGDMKALLREAATVDSPWLSRFGTRKYTFGGVKVGVANLKPNTNPKGPNVYSEGVLLKWKGDAGKLAHFNLSGRIVVCWQNIRKSAFNTGVDAIAQMIEKAFADFLDQAPV